MIDVLTARIIDARDLFCPEPVMMLHNAVRDATPGEILEVLATDPSTERDVPKFCRFLGHELLLAEKRDDVFVYQIKTKTEE